MYKRQPLLGFSKQKTSKKVNFRNCVVKQITAITVHYIRQLQNIN